MSEQRGALVQAVGIQLFDRACNRRVGARPAISELREVGHLVCERMLEGVLDVGIQRLLEHELRLHERGQASSKLLTRQIRDARQDRLGDLLPDHRCGLQHLLLAFSEPVDPGRQHALHGRGDLERLHGRDEAVGRSLALELSGLDQAAYRLFREEGVAARSRIDDLGDALEKL